VGALATMINSHESLLSTADGAAFLKESKSVARLEVFQLSVAWAW